MIIRTQQGVYTHSHWWQQAKVENTKTSLLNTSPPVGSLLLLQWRKKGMSNALFNDIAAALEKSQPFFDVPDWCKKMGQSSQGTKKRKEG